MKEKSESPMEAMAKEAIKEKVAEVLGSPAKLVGFCPKEPQGTLRGNGQRFNAR